MMKAIILTIINLFILFAVLFIGHYWSGWGVLARAYRFHGKFIGRQRWTFVSARMGTREADTLLGAQRPLFSLRSCLNIRINETGVHLSLFPLFRPFNPPLFIPWDHISAEVFRGALTTGVEFRFREGAGVCLRLSERVGRDLVMHSPGQLLREAISPAV